MSDIGRYARNPQQMLQNPIKKRMVTTLRSAGFDPISSVCAAEIATDDRSASLFARGISMTMSKFSGKVDFAVIREAVYNNKGDFSRSDRLLSDFLLIQSNVRNVVLTPQDKFFIASIDHSIIPSPRKPEAACSFGTLLEMGFDRKQIVDLFCTIGPDATFAQLCGV